MNNKFDLIVVGGGLAGSEAAWQAAKRGIKVCLYEMRPGKTTGAHQSPYLAELVCSNSLGSTLPDRAAGILKDELRRLDSLLIQCADQTAVPAGNALAVDRDFFAKKVTASIQSHPLIKLINQEIINIPEGPTIIATGPLTSPQFTESIIKLTGHEQIFFYDAVSPIINYESIDLNIAYHGTRYGNQFEENNGDYLNCPMNENEYNHFVNELTKAERANLYDFEAEITTGVRAGLHKYFEGCLPVEIIAMRGKNSLAYGPLRPVGLTDHRTGKHSYAVVQLRQDNLSRTLFNMVGFQTNLKYSEQQRVFRLIPGLEHAQFSRFGQMHRNTFIYSPGLIRPSLQYRAREDLFFAGQITGIEGYVGNIASGLLAGWNAANFITGKPLIELPRETMIGALCHYITHADAKDFQPMKANLGILPEIGNDIRGRRERAKAYAKRSMTILSNFLELIDH